MKRLSRFLCLIWMLGLLCACQKADEADTKKTDENSGKKTESAVIDTGSTTAATTPTGTTDIGRKSIVGRWTQHVEGENVEMTALYSFFDDGTGALITFMGLVTGEITYTYSENGRYNVSIEAKMFGQTDSNAGSGYMYVEGDYLHVVADDDETTVLRRLTDDEVTVALELAEKVGVRF